LNDEAFAAKLAGIAFFGTHFLHMHRRKLQQFCRVFTEILSWLYYAVVVSVCTILIEGAFLIHLPTTFIIYVLIGIVLVGTVSFNYRSSLRQYADRKLLEFLSEKQEVICDRLAQPSPACPTYVATVPRDEAAFVLTSVDGISVIPWVGLAMALRAVKALFITFLCLCAGSVIIDDTLLEVGDLKRTLTSIALIVPLLIILLPLIAAPFAAALRGNRFAFGWEGIVTGSTVRIQPSQVPPWDGDKVRRGNILLTRTYPAIGTVFSTATNK
jgi:hypothetical protein